MNGVVVIFGVRRIDGDERHVTPILASGQSGRLRCLSLRQHGRGEDVRDIMGVDGNQANGAFAFDRAESFDDRACGQAESALARHFDGDEVAVDGAAGAVGRNRKLAAQLFLIDWNEPAAAPGSPRKMPSMRCLARSISLMTRPVVSSSALLGCSTRKSARSPTPGVSPAALDAAPRRE